MEKKDKSCGNSDTIRNILKYICLVSLTLQNAAYILILKTAYVKDKSFSTSTVISISEIIKGIISFVMMMIFETGFTEIGKFFYNSTIKTPRDTLKVFIPAFCYVVMNNLSYVSGTRLDVITYQIISQVKIPMTVMFAIFLLRSTFRKLQYFSLFILIVGVIIVIPFAFVEEKSVSRKLITSDYDKTVGCTTGLISGILSGFAGVYFERILKTTDLSVWARNVQLSLISIPTAFLHSFVMDAKKFQENGFFFGYTYLVWILVALQSTSGLTTALSVKLADNVAKGYATTASIIVSSIISTIIFHYQFNYLMVFGAVLVIVSIPMYAITFSPSKIEPFQIEDEEKECYI